MKKYINPFYKDLPVLDLHGVDRMYAIVRTNEFIQDNLKLGNKKLIIIHGIGLGIVKKSVHDSLKNNKKVKEYYLDNMNIGETIVILE